jgi:hypothetical protein
MLSKTLLICGIAILFCDAAILAQNNFLNTTSTAVPFLRTETDARSAGIGTTSVAALNDANAIFNNASKNIFAEDSIGATVNYRNGFEESYDANILSASAFYKLNEKNIISAGYRNLNANVQYSNISTGVIIDEHAHESVVDINYARKLSSNFAAGISLKYIHSNVPLFNMTGNTDNPASTIAGDLSCIYKQEFSFLNANSIFTLGANISNIGNKIAYTSYIQRDFIPANLGIGAGYNFQFANRNKLLITCDLNKLMIPTPDTLNTNNNSIPDYKEEKVLESILKSFSDAPGGFEEEIHEINLATGLEYNFDDQLFIRGGYFYEHPTKGGRQFYTTGAGLRYKFLQYDIAYLIPADIPQNPLEPVVTMTLAASF